MIQKASNNVADHIRKYSAENGEDDYLQSNDN